MKQLQSEAGLSKTPKDIEIAHDSKKQGSYCMF